MRNNDTLGAANPALFPKAILSGVVLLLALLFNTPALANQQQSGPYEIHYSAFNSTFLTPEVARNYQIQRSRYNAVINISVLDTRADKAAAAVQISGTAKNLLGNSVELEFREIRDGSAIYYISELTFSNDENFRFALEISDGKSTYPLKFQKTFYAD